MPRRQESHPGEPHDLAKKWGFICHKQLRNFILGNKMIRSFLQLTGYDEGLDWKKPRMEAESTQETVFPSCNKRLVSYSPATRTKGKFLKPRSGAGTCIAAPFSNSPSPNSPEVFVLQGSSQGFVPSDYVPIHDLKMSQHLKNCSEQHSEETQACSSQILLPLKEFLKFLS